jgi:hypothetical protein
MEEDNTRYFNDEWNKVLGPKGTKTEFYRLEILDFEEDKIKIYTLEEYNKLIKNKDADKHTK